MARRKRKTLPKDWASLCESSSVEELKTLLEDGYELYAYNDRFQKLTAWMTPCTPLEVVRWLIEERGADIQHQGEFAATALSEALETENEERIRALIDLGADVTRPRDLAMCARFKRVKAARILLESGAHPDPDMSDFNRPLSEALHRTPDFAQSLELVEVFLSYGAKIRRAQKDYLLEAAHDFEFRRQSLSEERIAAQEPALLRLYEIFDVEPVSRRIMHDGASDIVLVDGDIQTQYDALWEALIPPSGEAATEQGEAIRITGQIHDEIFRNAGGNWSRMHRNMLREYARIVSSGNPLDEDDLERVDTLCRALPDDDEAIWPLSELAVEWVRRNPTPIAR